MTHSFYDSFESLERTYKALLKEASRVLKNKGLLIFKCQDFTDSKTIMTHYYVIKWALDNGFYVDDMAILVKENKVYNGNLKQRHLRKIHTYFLVMYNKKRK
jgi:ubiquinone/menaquinone biosynthesis C-methylase UbiE